LSFSQFISVIRVLWGKSLQIPHKKTLFHTAAHFKGSDKTGQGLLIRKTTNLFNEVKDLAKGAKAGSEANTEQN
jgi:hypothetical protein